MKYLLTHFRLVLIIQIALACITNAELGPIWREKCSRMAAALRENPSKKGILELGGELVGVGQYNSGSEEETRVIRDITSTLISIPGHALYFAEKIKREQESVKDFGLHTGPRNDYDRNRNYYINGVMQHLPSPETIQVLGEFLADEKDLPPYPRSASLRGNCSYAVEALTRIGLRDSPQKFKEFTDSRLDLKLWRSWWEEVKSGRRTFSFIGQKVEYRFKPDGTWDTIPIANPPDDAPGRPEAGAAKRPTRRPEAAVSETETPASGVPWPWILVATILLLGGVTWRAMRSRNA